MHSSEEESQKLSVHQVLNARGCGPGTPIGSTRTVHPSTASDPDRCVHHHFDGTGWLTHARARGVVEDAASLDTYLAQLFDSGGR